MRKRTDKYERVLELLAEGHITQSEAADLLGVSRQRIHNWIKAANVHPAAARVRYLRKLLNAGERIQV